NLHLVHERISLILENQYNEIKAMVAKDKTQVSHEQNILFYAELITKISSYALKKEHEQFDKVLHAFPVNPLESYTSIFTMTMGLLYAHTIQECLGYRKLIITTTARIHQRYVSLLSSQQHTRGWPVGSENKAQSLTKRNLSTFESEKARMNRRKCGVCKKVGYNSRICPDRVVDMY
ncbi:4817_t:CDS:2, partial [Racocetra persica]